MIRPFRPLLFLVALFLLAIPVALHPSAESLLLSLVGMFVFSAMLSRPRHARLCVTLTTTEILMDTLDAFKIALAPILRSFTTDFSNARSRKGESIIAHVRSLPTVQDYDAAGGFKTNAVAADSLLTDVPCSLNYLKHVPVKVPYLTQLASRKNLYIETIKETGYVLAKKVLDDILGNITPANFSFSVTESIANWSLDSLENIRSQMNTQRAGRMGRVGIIGTAAAGKLQLDQRVGSYFFYGQLNGDQAYRHWTNIAGFRDVWEYPDLPSTSNLTAFFGEERSHVLACRLPNVQDASDAVIEVPSIAKFEVITDPDTGLSMLGIFWQEAGTFDIYGTVALLYGFASGAQGGAAGTICDRAGVRAISS